MTPKPWQRVPFMIGATAGLVGMIALLGVVCRSGGDGAPAVTTANTLPPAAPAVGEDHAVYMERSDEVRAEPADAPAAGRALDDPPLRTETPATNAAGASERADEDQGEGEEPDERLPPPSGESEQIAKWQADLRSGHNRTLAAMELRKRGLSVDFDRQVDSSPKRPDDASEWLEVEAELVGDDLVVRWAVWFGSQVVGPDIGPAKIEITVKGGSLPNGESRRHRPTVGDNTGTETFANVGPGSYWVSLFLWSERRGDGLQLSNNGPPVQLEKR
ncbi:MAG TPA: hypothetical protein VML75_01880 [Kofleriaceae bacterium]|nr:hypothetical protein [Kofleriaceae bacterium]